MNLLKYFCYSILLLALVIGSSCASKRTVSIEDLQIAVIADVHLQDVYGQLKDSDYRGLRNPKNGKYALIRTMGSQLRSTRIFNENYFAFLAVLDDVAKRNVKYVLLPGDFSDDGQPLHIRGLKRILDHYSRQYGISFYLITGNHDVVQPYDHNDGKIDFLGKNGKPQPIMSRSDLYISDTDKEHATVITSDIKNLGYVGITELLGDFGFFPQKDDFYWASPFSDYTYASYEFKKAKRSSTLEKRSYLIPLNGISLPDVSYLVEPIEGLWILALDANTYLKKETPKNNTEAPFNYANSGKGHDNLLYVKNYLSEWVGKVTREAEKLDKTLIAFSHYPMVDFTNDANKHIDNLLVGSKMQLKRVPDENVARMFADAGLKIHFGGHMHMNDTGIRTTSGGNTLVNIQVPSLAAYKPAYKLISINGNGMAEVNSIVVDSVPDFDQFFPLYEQEHDYLRSIGSKDIWNRDILSSKNYNEFINWHLKELVRLRFMKSDWPSDFADFLMNISGDDLLVLSQLNKDESFEKVLKNLQENNQLASAYRKESHQRLLEKGIDPGQYAKWSGFDLLFDLYRLRSADELAYTDIGEDSLGQYAFLISSYLNGKHLNLKDDSIQRRLYEFMNILQKFLNGEPSGHFQVDLKSGNVISLKKDKNN